LLKWTFLITSTINNPTLPLSPFSEGGGSSPRKEMNMTKEKRAEFNAKYRTLNLDDPRWWERNQKYIDAADVWYEQEFERERSNQQRG